MQTNSILDELLEGFASLHRDLKIAAFSEKLACDHRRDSSSFWNLAAVCAASPDEVSFMNEAESGFIHPDCMSPGSLIDENE